MTGARDPLAPAHGARLLLELDAATPDGARASYRAAVVTPDARFDYAAELDDDGGVALRAVGAAATPEHEEMLRMLARLTARAARGKRDDGLPPWPPRITRWRGPGRGA